MGIKRYLNKINNLIKALLYKILKRVLWGDISRDIIGLSKISIVNTSATLKEVGDAICNKQQGVYMRFGDGDVFLMKMERDSFQKPNLKLADEMKEAFECKGKNVHKCLAIHSKKYGFEEGMFYGNHLVSDNNAKDLLKDTFQFFIGERIYSPIALHFKATSNIEEAKIFLSILKKYTKVFVGNEKMKEGLIKHLFGLQVTHIKTPSTNAYKDIERVYSETCKELRRIDSFCVIVVAMGCSGRPLMKRIFKDDFNVYLFDFGSLLDGINGNLTRAWLKKNDIDYEYLLSGL